MRFCRYCNVVFILSEIYLKCLEQARLCKPEQHSRQTQEKGLVCNVDSTYSNKRNPSVYIIQYMNKLFKSKIVNF